MGDIKEMTYPDMLSRFRERRNESEFLLPLMSQAGQCFDAFKTVQSCLSIGPGPGEYDLEFMKRCLPSLRRLVAVEKDQFCAEELKINIAKIYNGTLTSHVIVGDVEDFVPEGGQRFDSVLMFHMLYDLPTEGRKKLLKTALDQWIDQENGVIVIINMSDDLDDKKQPINVMQKLHRHFSDRMDLLLEADFIREDLKPLGSDVVWSQKYKCDLDFRVYDSDIAQLFNLYTDKFIDNETMKRALDACEPSLLGTYVGEMLIVKKKH